MDLIDEVIEQMVRPAGMSRRGFLGLLGITACTVDFGRRAIQQGMDLLNPNWKGSEYRWDCALINQNVIGNELPRARLFSVKTGKELHQECIYVNETTGEYEAFRRDRYGLFLLNARRDALAIRKGKVDGGIRVEFTRSIEGWRNILAELRSDLCNVRLDSNKRVLHVPGRPSRMIASGP